jgi:phosphoribosylformylglycinamidine synthase PurS subunit
MQRRIRENSNRKRSAYDFGGLGSGFSRQETSDKAAKPNSDDQERSSIYNQFANMKAYVTVMLKTTVLDPQGKTIHGALKKMGYKGVDAVRQGKFFELNLDGGLDKNAAKAEVERIAKEVLTNPVIEEFSYRIEE